MSNATEIPATMQPVEPKQPAARKTSLLYCLAFVAIQLPLIISCLWIASRPWFLKHNNYPSTGEQIGYSLRARGLNCEILIYGDSTAEVNLDPSLIQSRTGLKTCNISEMRPVHRLVGSFFPLDQYLAHNTAPRFILTMWNPTAFHPSATQLEEYSPEGVVYALQYYPSLYLWKGFYNHPSWLTNFVTYVIRSIIADMHMRSLELLHVQAPRRPGISEIPRDVQAGLWSIDLPPQKTCETNTPDPLNKAEKEASIAAFRKRYSTAKTTVLLDMGPLADCYKDIGQIASSNAGLHDNIFELLPNKDFNFTSIHLTPEARQHVTEEAADQILQLMNGGPGQQQQNNDKVERPQSR